MDQKEKNSKPENKLGDYNPANRDFQRPNTEDKEDCGETQNANTGNNKDELRQEDEPAK